MSAPLVHPVALVAGDRVHHRITGHVHEEPAAIAWDEHTRTARELERQTDDMTAHATEMLASQGLTITETEVPLERTAQVGHVEVRVTGTLDLLCLDPEGRRVLLDLKTGARRPVMSWMQIAIYAWLCQHAHTGLPHHAGFLWVKRSSSKAMPRHKGEMCLRPGHDLVSVAEGMIRQMALIAEYGPDPRPSPVACSSCTRQCPASASESHS